MELRLMSMQGDMAVISNEAAKKSDLLFVILKNNSSCNEESLQDNDIVKLQIDTNILIKVIEFLNYTSINKLDELPKPIPWPSITNDFVDTWIIKYLELDTEDIIKLIRAAEYLIIPSLLELLLAQLARDAMIKSNFKKTIQTLEYLAITINQEKL